MGSEMCIRDSPQTDQTDYIFIRSGRGCASYIGRQKGVQNMNIDREECLTKQGNIMHELLHALGFLHEHTRSDRDDYINIHLENVIESKDK